MHQTKYFIIRILLCEILLISTQEDFFCLIQDFCSSNKLLYAFDTGN